MNKATFFIALRLRTRNICPQTGNRSGGSIDEQYHIRPGCHAPLLLREMPYGAPAPHGCPALSPGSDHSFTGIGPMAGLPSAGASRAYKPVSVPIQMILRSGVLLELGACGSSRE